MVCVIIIIIDLIVILLNLSVLIDHSKITDIRYAIKNKIKNAFFPMEEVTEEEYKKIWKEYKKSLDK